MDRAEWKETKVTVTVTDAVAPSRGNTEADSPEVTLSRRQRIEDRFFISLILIVLVPWLLFLAAGAIRLLTGYSIFGCI